MDLETWNLMAKAGSYLPPHVAPWAQWMQLTLFLLPVAFLKYWPPRILLLTQVANMVTAVGVFAWEGNQVTRLFGVGHVFWLIPLYLLARDWSRQKSRLYRGFIAVAVATMTVSLIFDARDAALWLMGDRGSILVGVPPDSPLYRE